MTDTAADTDLQTRRREAVANDLAGELTSEDVIAEIRAQVCSTSSAEQLEELTQLRAFRERYRAHAAALASVRLEGQELDEFSRALAARWVEGELSDEEELAELDRHFGHPRARTQR